MSQTIGERRSRIFGRQFRLLQSTASLPTLFGVFGYMLLLTDLSFAEWATWWTCLIVYGSAVGLIFERRHQGQVAPIRSYLDGEEGDGDRKEPPARPSPFSWRFPFDSSDGSSWSTFCRR